jgi:hypothetical protein
MELSDAICIKNLVVRLKEAESLYHVSCSSTLSCIKVAPESRLPSAIRNPRASQLHGIFTIRLCNVLSLNKALLEETTSTGCEEPKGNRIRTTSLISYNRHSN